MHIAEVVTIAKSLPLLRLNTYKSLILSYSADYRRILRKKQKDMKMKGYRFWKTHCFTILKFPIWRNSVFSILKYLTGFGCCIKRHLWKWKGGLYIVYICLQKNATEIFMPKTLKYFSV